jgi:hypothetical protein
MSIKDKNMTRPVYLVVLLVFLAVFQAEAQKEKQETTLKREVTLYNPYKPSLTEIRKISFLPDMNDTVRMKPQFSYMVTATPFQPAYTVSPIKAAVLQADPLPKLYKGYVSLGYGNHITPFAELSITNQRSKKAAFGFYGHHFSTNDDIMLKNAKRVYGGYMDNDASLFGKGIFDKCRLEGSVNYTQKVRHAYGYDPIIMDYDPLKSTIRRSYTNLGAKLALTSVNLDSTGFIYDFNVFFNNFRYAADYSQNNGGIDGYMAKEVSGFYAGAGISVVDYSNSDSTGAGNQYLASVNPFVKKRTDQWNFKLGFKVLVDRNSVLHVYPDLEFGFNIVPSYLSFFTSLSGKMERNDPMKIMNENPYLVNNQFPAFIEKGSMFRLPDTDHKLIVTAGLKGGAGLTGSYIVSASYSKINNMIFYTNLLFPDTVAPRAMGNLFAPMADPLQVLNLHAEMNGNLTEKLSVWWKANYYQYTLDLEKHAWNKPDWDAKLGLKYNLRDKIIASFDLTALGKRWEIVNGDYRSYNAGYLSETIQMPVHVNMNIMAEYRYSKILSFWARVNNIAFGQYNEWAYYPSQRFIGMLGFTYSL